MFAIDMMLQSNPRPISEYNEESANNIEGSPTSLCQLSIWSCKDYFYQNIAIAYE